MKSIDQVREFWDRRPCNILASNHPVGSPEYLAATEARKYKVEPHIPGFAEFDKWKDKEVLEIGCGIGVDTANFIRAGARVTAVDVSVKSIDIAVRRVVSLSGHCCFWCDNAETLRFKPNLFDLVYAFGSIHHSPHPIEILYNARESIKPGGTLKLMVYNKYSWKSLWILLKFGRGRFWKFKELIARYSEAQTGCPITYVYSKKEIRELVERAGFRVKKIEIAHIFPYDVAAYKRYEYRRAFPWGIITGRVFRWLEARIGWHLLIEAAA